MTDSTEPTAEELAELRAYRHVPDRAEISALLHENFVGPIPEERIDYIANNLEREMRLSMRTHNQSFREPLRWRGKQWYERIPKTRTAPTPVDLVLKIGNGLAEMFQFPAPKLYCPEPFVGIWEQEQPSPKKGERVLWHLSADSTFHTDYPIPYHRDPPRFWCIVKSIDPNESRVSLWIASNHTDCLFDIHGVEPDESAIVGESREMFSPRIPFRLNRVR